MNWQETTLEILIITIPLAILQFLLSNWIKSRLENSIKHEYDKFLEEYKYEIKVREQAARVSKYLALARRLKEDSPESDYERANQLSWELAMWLPSNIYKSMAKAIVTPDNETNELTVTIEVRKILLKDKAGNLKSDDIAHHGPGIGNNNGGKK